VWRGSDARLSTLPAACAASGVLNGRAVLQDIPR
jgi:hypothetical protein